MMTGESPPSSRCLRSSFEIRGTATTEYCRRAARRVSTGRHAAKRQNARRNGSHARWFSRFLALFVERPSGRSAAAVQASKEDRSRLATDAVLVAPREIAIDPIPHGRALLRVCVMHGRRAKTMPSTVMPPLGLESRDFVGFFTESGFVWTDRSSRLRSNNDQIWKGKRLEL
jgi:hypothetical protein